MRRPSGIRAELEALSTDPTVHGIILQTPLPPTADFDSLASAIDPAKDIDGANPQSLGLLAARLPAFAPGHRRGRHGAAGPLLGPAVRARTPWSSAAPPWSANPLRCC